MVLMRRLRRRSLALLALLLGGACYSPAVLAAWEQHVGPAPHLALPTLGGSQLWADVRWRDGWRVQRHTWTGHHRLLDQGNVRRAWGSLDHCVARLMTSAEAEPAGSHLVVVLHGLGRTRRSMAPIEERLTREGWRVASLSYPSTRAGIAGHARDVEDVLANLEGPSRVSFVTHSLGGLVAREVLERDRAGWRKTLTPAALVQLAPPNQGAQLARRLDVLPVRLICGPSFATLASRERVLAPELDLTVTVITGTHIGNPLITGANDGVVGVQEARLAGAYLRVLPGALHTVVMRDPRALDLILHALESVR